MVERLQFAEVDPYIFDADECYKSPLGFNSTVDFLNAIIVDDNVIITQPYLIIEINEGVFIRSKDKDFCRLLDKYCQEVVPEDDKFRELELIEWDRLTSLYLAPINWTGDYKLGRWRSGFK